jgi:carbonic anhydrase/acetyltransferase-like protein (isoleucine patch superfamily)
MSMKLVRGVYLADSARVMGDVEIGAGSSVWFGSVVRGDCARITIGERTNIQDNCTVHCDDDVPNVIGSRVTLGHGVIAHGVEIGDGSLIGIGARLLAGCRIGRGCLVAAGSVVPPNLVVPDGMVVMGLPGRVLRATTDQEKRYLAEVPERYLSLAKLHHERPDDPRVRDFA